MTTSYTIDQKRWASLSIFEQMGNIYSEVGRSFSAQRRNNIADCQAATERAIELFDATLAEFTASKSPKSREVLQAKEQYLATLHDKLAIAARITR
jgi:hypothetical protein